MTWPEFFCCKKGESIFFCGSCISRREEMLLIKLVYFCGEEETVNNFFFDCCVASLMWNSISMEVCVLVGSDFESIGRWWISNNKNTVLNCVCAATLWYLETA